MQTPGVCLLLVTLFAARVASASDIARFIKDGQQFQAQGRFVEAEQQFQLAVSGSEDGSQGPELRASALANLANVETDLGRSDTAARLYNRAIALATHSTPRDSRIVDELNLRLAELYLEGGQVGTAERLIDHALLRTQSGRTVADWDDAVARDLRAGVYAYRKKLPEAERTERDAITRFEALNGENNAEYAVAVMHLAMFLNMQKRAAEALPYAQRALAVSEALPVRPLSIEIDARVMLAAIYSQLGRDTEARTRIQEALEIAENHYGFNHPRTGRLLLAQAAVLRAVGDKKAAHIAQTRGKTILAAADKGTSLAATVPLQALRTGGR